MKNNKIIDKIKKRQLTFGIMNFEFFSKGIKTILEQAGAEFVFFDQEHSEVSYDQLKFLSQNSENLLSIKMEVNKKKDIKAK